MFNSNLQILEEINKYKSYTKFETKHKNDINDDDLYICKIEKKDRNSEYVYITKKGYDEIAKKEDSKIPEIFVPLLNPKMERYALYCAGKAGDGKGVFVSDLARQYHILHPKNPIYYICSTPLRDDISFSKFHDFIKQIQIDIFRGKPEDEIMKQLENSLVIMDDCDNLPKEDREVLISLQKTILFLGRKYKISLFKISHYKTDSHNTRSLITELDYYITFVNRDIKSDRLLKEYKKLNKKTYEHFKGSIWAFFNFKLDYCITNKKIFFLE